MGTVQGTCPIHGLTDFYDDDPNLGGKRGKCRACNSARTKANDDLREDACFRIFGHRSFKQKDSDWLRGLTDEQRKKSCMKSWKITVDVTMNGSKFPLKLPWQ